MKILIFSGSHCRHYYLHSKIIERFSVVGVVHMERESVIPLPDEGWDEKYRQLFIRHFSERKSVEDSYFGDYTSEIFADIPTISLTNRSLLNSLEVHDFVLKLDPDICVIFGVDIIKDPVFSALPYWKLNVHLGLSPWYKGAATLFWPFYNLEPQYAGATIHNIELKADAGEIFHHSIPVMEETDGLHDHAAKVVVQATDDLQRLLQKILDGDKLNGYVQKSSGKLFLEKEFRPEHLETLYEIYQNSLSRYFLEGRLNSRYLKLVNNFEDN